MKSLEVMPEGAIPDAARLLARCFESTAIVLPERIAGMAVKCGIDPERTGLIPRVTDEYFMRRHLRRAVARKEENEKRNDGKTWLRAGSYLSDDAMKRQLERHARTQKMLRCMQVECIGSPDGQGIGYSASLEEIAAASLSNPRNRQAERMFASTARSFEPTPVPPALR